MPSCLPCCSDATNNSDNTNNAQNNNHTELNNLQQGAYGHQQMRTGLERTGPATPQQARLAEGTQLYHGTDRAAARNISHSGFQPRPANFGANELGDGAYLTDDRGAAATYSLNRNVSVNADRRVLALTVPEGGMRGDIVDPRQFRGHPDWNNAAYQQDATASMNRSLEAGGSLITDNHGQYTLPHAEANRMESRRYHPTNRPGTFREDSLNWSTSSGNGNGSDRRTGNGNGSDRQSSTGNGNGNGSDHHSNGNGSDRQSNNSNGNGNGNETYGAA